MEPAARQGGPGQSLAPGQGREKRRDRGTAVALGRPVPKFSCEADNACSDDWGAQKGRKQLQGFS